MAGSMAGMTDNHEYGHSLRTLADLLDGSGAFTDDDEIISCTSRSFEPELNILIRGTAERGKAMAKALGLDPDSHRESPGGSGIHHVWSGVSDHGYTVELAVVDRPAR